MSLIAIDAHEVRRYKAKLSTSEEFDKDTPTAHTRLEAGRFRFDLDKNAIWDSNTRAGPPVSVSNQTLQF